MTKTRCGRSRPARSARVGSDAGPLEPGYMPDEPRVFWNPRARATVKIFHPGSIRSSVLNTNVNTLSDSFPAARGARWCIVFCAFCANVQIAIMHDSNDPPHPAVSQRSSPAGKTFGASSLIITVLWPWSRALAEKRYLSPDPENWCKRQVCSRASKWAIERGSY
jgi:hypothetical protein